MKPIFQRLIRIFSCCLVIGTVLLCSIFVPAMAAGPRIIDPSDCLFDAVHFSNGTSQYFFNFWDNPIYQAYFGSTLDETFIGGMNWELDSGYSVYRLSVSPIGGTNFTSSPACVIDISDFKSSSVLELTYTPQFRVDVYNAGPGDLTYRVNGHVALYWYDKDMNYIGYTNSPTVENTGIYGQPDFIWTLDLTFNMVIPENASYLIPRYTMAFYPPESGVLYRIRSTEYQSFTMMVKKDDIIENSETMQKIAGELDDLNNKADQIITGTPEQNQAAADAESTVNDFQADANSTKDMEQEWLDDFEESSDILNDRLTGFVDGKGFTQLSALVSPIMTWESSSIIMLLVIAFINMSVILFGR